MQLDTLQSISTPEGIRLDIRVAGPMVRFLAWVIDACFRMAIVIAFIFALLPFGKLGSGFWLILMFLLEWFYPVIFEIYYHGATPGKKIMGILVMKEDGAPMTWSASLLRNILRFVDFLPIFYGFALVSMLLRQDFKRLGDLSAGTLVIYAEPNPISPTEPNAESLALTFPLSIEMQRAIIDYSQRSQQFSEQRQQELADMIPVLTGDQAQNRIQRLHGIAKWLLNKS